jgi:hypothetical protein
MIPSKMIDPINNSRSRVWLDRGNKMNLLF